MGPQACRRATASASPCTARFVSYIATIVEVAVDDKGKLTVPRVDTAIDCGTYVNPERIHSQIEGAAIMGLSLAKYGEITFKDGKVQQSNFDDFPVIRIDESPAITNVHIVPPAPGTPPSGVGEPGVPPFAPALINAIFAATGKRIRALRSASSWKPEVGTFGTTSGSHRPLTGADR